MKDILPYNKKLLLKDVKFPLVWGDEDYKMFIFDSNGHMIAQTKGDFNKRHEHIFHKLIGEYKEFIPLYSNLKYYADEGDIYENLSGEYIGLVRGWGRLQKLKNPEKRQDNILEYLLNVLNS